MKNKEKLEEIKKAVQSGVAKRRIDRKGNGRNVRRLLEGKRVSEECVEEMYSNLLEYRKNPCKAKVRLEKYSDSYPEVPQKEKMKAIRRAIKSGTKKNDLDPFGGGDAVRKLEKGKRVGSSKINEMYTNLLILKKSASMKKKAKAQKKQEKKGQDHKKRQAQSDCCTKADTNSVGEKEQIKALLEKVKILEEKVRALSGALNPRTPLKV